MSTLAGEGARNSVFVCMHPEAKPEAVFVSRPPWPSSGGRLDRARVAQAVGRTGPPRSRGSSTSRSASPSMLKPYTASEMAAPGQRAIHGAWYM
jgi:hypothetical protein